MRQSTACQHRHWAAHKPTCESHTEYARTLTPAEGEASNAWESLSRWMSYQNLDIKLAFISALRLREKRRDEPWKKEFVVITLRYEGRKRNIWEMFRCESAAVYPWAVAGALGHGEYAAARAEEEKKLMGMDECLGVGTVVVACPNLPVGESVRGKQVATVLMIPVFSDDLLWPFNPRWEDVLERSLSTKKTVHNRS